MLTRDDTITRDAGRTHRIRQIQPRPTGLSDGVRSLPTRSLGSNHRDPDPDAQSCGGEEYWSDLTAYRKIAYSSCVDGKRLDGGARHQWAAIRGHGFFFSAHDPLHPGIVRRSGRILVPPSRCVPERVSATGNINIWGMRADMNRLFFSQQRDPGLQGHSSYSSLVCVLKPWSVVHRYVRTPRRDVRYSSGPRSRVGTCPRPK